MFIIVGSEEVRGGGFPVLCDCGTLSGDRSAQVKSIEDVDHNFLGWGHAGADHGPATFPTLEEAERIAKILKDGKDWRSAMVLNKSYAEYLRPGALYSVYGGTTI